MANTAGNSWDMVRGSREATTPQYTEEDIAQIEASDLTDPAVCSELLSAYYQNDTGRGTRLSLKRDLNVFVPEPGGRVHR